MKRIKKALKGLFLVTALALILSACQVGEHKSTTGMEVTFLKDCNRGIAVVVHNPTEEMYGFQTYAEQGYWHDARPGQTVTLRYTGHRAMNDPWIIVSRESGLPDEKITHRFRTCK